MNVLHLITQGKKWSSRRRLKWGKKSLRKVTRLVVLENATLQNAKHKTCWLTSRLSGNLIQIVSPPSPQFFFFAKHVLVNSQLPLISSSFWAQFGAAGSHYQKKRNKGDLGTEILSPTHLLHLLQSSHT